MAMEKLSEIAEELQRVSPYLGAMAKANVFTVPDQYFNDLSNRIVTTVFLHQYEKGKGQQVPDGYFEGLSNTILAENKKF